MSKNIKRALTLLLVLGATLLLVQPALAATVQIRTGSGNQEGYRNHDDSGWVARGNLVQIVRDDGDGIEAPGTNGLPNGGDTVLCTGEVGNGFLGDPLGRFTISNLNVNGGDVIYIRVWEGWNGTGNPPSGSSWYVTTALITVPSGVSVGWYYNIGAGWYNASGVPQDGAPATPPNTPASSGSTWSSYPPAAPAGTLQFSAATYNVNENGGTATITVTRTGGSGGAASVNYATSPVGSTATAGSDYIATSGPLNWANGDAASKTFTVSITDDAVYEGNETVNLTLSGATGATLGSPNTAILTIIDNETPPVAGSLQFSAATYSVAENVATATITVTRTSGSNGIVGVTYATSPGGTATAGSDYTATTNTLSWADGDLASKTFTVTIINDSTYEPDETVNLTLSAPTGGAALGSPGTATLTITNDDPVPPAGSLQFSAATYSVAENVATATITVTRTSGSNGAVGITYATSNGTATAGSDYTATTNTLSWADGDSANKTFTVTIINDSVNELSETVNLTLSAPTGGASLGSPSTATLTITDDDAVTTAPDITGVTPSSPNRGQTIVISGTRFGTSEGSSTITVGGVTVEPTSWSDSSITATIPSGVATGEVALVIITPGGTDSINITVGGGDTLGSIYIDDFEGGCVGNFQAPATSSGYYAFDNGVTPGNTTINADLKQAAAVHDGSLGASVRYSYTTGYGGGWGAVLANTRDLSAANYISFYVKWDGSNNDITLSFKDSGGHVYAATVPNAALAALGTNYGKVTINRMSFSEDTGDSTRTAGAIDWTRIANYNFVYKTRYTSLSSHYIDSLIATASSGGDVTTEVVITSISPNMAPAGNRITVNGLRFGSAQGSSYLSFENLTTRVSYNAEIVSWSDTAIEAIVPRLAAAGTYEVKVTRVAITAGTVTAMQSNPSSFLITASAAGGDIVNVRPNPFNPNTETVLMPVTNTYGATNVGYYIFDMTARLVYKHVVTASGTTASDTWDGKDLTRVLVGDGAYILRVINEDTKSLIAKGKILVVKK